MATLSRQFGRVASPVNFLNTAHGADAGAPAAGQQAVDQCQGQACREYEGQTLSITKAYKFINGPFWPLISVH